MNPEFELEAAVTHRGLEGVFRGFRWLESAELVFQTREQASEIADLVAELLPDPSRGRLGLVELLFNAVEHGNLGIGGELKIELLRTGRFDAELARRAAMPEYAGRRAHLQITKEHGLFRMTIRDEGSGFAWRERLLDNCEASTAPAGRGICLVRTICFPEVEYHDPGNVVIVRAQGQR